MIKLGLAGVGRWGANILKTINSLDGVQIGALYSSNPENINLISKNAYFYNDPFCLIDDWKHSKLSGIIIASPAETHKPLIERCLSRGIPFFVEKPICDNLSDTLDICQKIEKSKISCLVDYTQLFNPAFQKLKEVSGGQKPTKLSSFVSSFGPFRGGIPFWYDWLPHDFSMILQFLDKIEIKKVCHYPNDKYKNSGEVIVIGDNFTIDIENDGETKARYFQYMVEGRRLEAINNDRFYLDNTVSLISGDPPLTGAIKKFLNLSAGEKFGLDITPKIGYLLEDVRKFIAG